MDSDIFDIVPGFSDAGGNMAQAWRQINDARHGVRQVDFRRVLDRDRVAEMRRRIMMASAQMFPFKVYLYQLSTGPELGKWFQFLVRSGRVQNVPLSAPNGGCDLYDANPYSDFIPNGSLLDPIVVPVSISDFYIWFEMVGGTPMLRYGTDIT
jgi:hypothetical protein